MTYKIVYKVTTWKELTVDTELSTNDIIKHLKNNDIDSIITNSEIQQEDFNLETERILTPRENDNDITIELYNNNEIIWNNNENYN